MDSQKSIDLLNRGVADELQAVHQYMYWHFHLDDQGFGPLASLLKRIAIMEMVHVETLAERVLFLGGDVEMVAVGPVEKITEPDVIVGRAATMEKEAADFYNRCAQESNTNADAATKRVFESLVIDEEEHFEQFDRQLDNIKRFGLSYLALQSFGSGAEENAN